MNAASLKNGRFFFALGGQIFTSGLKFSNEIKAA
tara:strand:- start:89 stop:190 length:102 start_codon:yes stop_codon:yes gene_type:complete